MYPHTAFCKCLLICLFTDSLSGGGQFALPENTELISILYISLKGTTQTSKIRNSTLCMSSY